MTSVWVIVLAPTRITVRWQRRTPFQKTAELEIRRVCPREVAQGHAPGERIHLGRQGVRANAEQRGTEVTRIVRLRGGAPLAHRFSGPTEDRQRLPARGPASAQTHVVGEHAFESVSALCLTGRYGGIAPSARALSRVRPWRASQHSATTPGSQPRPVRPGGTILQPGNGQGGC